MKEEAWTVTSHFNIPRFAGEGQGGGVLETNARLDSRDATALS